MAGGCSGLRYPRALHRVVMAQHRATVGATVQHLQTVDSIVQEYRRNWLPALLATALSMAGGRCGHCGLCAQYHVALGCTISLASAIALHHCIADRSAAGWANNLVFAQSLNVQ